MEEGVSTTALPSIRALTGTREQVSLSDLQNGGELPAELVPKAAPRPARLSDVQLTVNSRVTEVHQRWVAEGREQQWLRCPHAFYAVPPAKAKDMREKILKAGQLLKVRIWFGRADLSDNIGNTLITFTVVDLDLASRDQPSDPGLFSIAAINCCLDPAASRRENTRMTTDVTQTRGGLITEDHPYFHNLPGVDELLICACTTEATILVMVVPDHRLELCPACYRELALYLDRSCQLVFIGQAGLALRV